MQPQEKPMPWWFPYAARAQQAFLESRIDKSDKEILALIAEAERREREKIKGILKGMHKTVKKVNGKLSLRAEENRNGWNAALEMFLAKLDESSN